jgi:hypothetical protein
MTGVKQKIVASRACRIKEYPPEKIHVIPKYIQRIGNGISLSLLFGMKRKRYGKIQNKKKRRLHIK